MIVIIWPNDLLDFTADAWPTKGSVLDNLLDDLTTISNVVAVRDAETSRNIFVTMKLGMSCTLQKQRGGTRARPWFLCADGTSFLEERPRNFAHCCGKPKLFEKEKRKK